MQWALIFLVIAALSGCDCGEGGGADAAPDGGVDADAGTDAAFDTTPPDVGMAAEEAIDLTIESECRYAVLCTDTEPLHRRACHPREREEVRAARIAAVARGDVRVDPAAAEACRATAEATTCEDADPACGGLVPTRAPGERCGHPAACTEGLCTGATCPTTCMVGLGEDDPCDAPSDCARGLTCRDALCAPRIAAGEACSGLLDCIEGTVCDGTCQTLSEAPEGEPCDGFVTLCSRWLRCVGATCVRGGDPGDACDFDNPCRLEATCEAGVCVERVLPGAPCDATVLCPRSHACVEGSCSPRPLEGDACAPDRSCLAGACVDDVCTLRESPETCAAGPECRSSLCIRDLCEPAPAIGERCVAGCAPGGECRFVPGEARQCRPICG